MSFQAQCTQRGVGHIHWFHFCSRTSSSRCKRLFQLPVSTSKGSPRTSWNLNLCFIYTFSSWMFPHGVGGASHWRTPGSWRWSRDPPGRTSSNAQGVYCIFSCLQCFQDGRIHHPSGWWKQLLDMCGCQGWNMAFTTPRWNRTHKAGLVNYMWIFLIIVMAGQAPMPIPGGKGPQTQCFQWLLLLLYFFWLGFELCRLRSQSPGWKWQRPTPTLLSCRFWSELHLQALQRILPPMDCDQRIQERLMLLLTYLS